MNWDIIEGKWDQFKGQLKSSFAKLTDDDLKIDLQANYTQSKFHRESPTVLVITPASSGVTVTYDNTTGPIPTNLRMLRSRLLSEWAR